jgi:hypothetical protein
MMRILRDWTIALASIAAGFALLWSVSTAHAQADPQWIHRLGTDQDATITAMSVGPTGDVVVAGLFRGTVDFDPGPGEMLLSAGANETSFLVRYSSAGNLIWAYKFQGTDDVRINDVVVDDIQYIGVAGSFKGEVDLDPGPGSFYRISEGGDDIWRKSVHAWMKMHVLANWERLWNCPCRLRYALLPVLRVGVMASISPIGGWTKTAKQFN